MASRPGPLHLHTGTGAPHDRYSMRGQPRHDVGDLRRCQRLIWDGIAPVGHAEVCSTGNDGSSQGLIAHERKVGGIHDRPPIAASVAVRAMTAGTMLAIERRERRYLRR
jgi:hypothetical protein